MFYRHHQISRHISADPSEQRQGWTRDALFKALDQRFTFTDEVTRTFAADVLWRNVLTKIQTPTGLITRPWLSPGGDYFGNPKAYWGGYIWDTAFMVDVLSWLPGTEDLITGVIENYWDWQRAQDAVTPETWRHGAIAGLNPTATSVGPGPGHQLPLFAWACLRAHQHHPNPELIRRALTCLDAWHEWIWRERSLDGSGLCVLGNYHGSVRTARDENYDTVCDTDGMRLIPHPQRPQGPAHYGDIWTVSVTSYVIKDEECLVQLALIAGDRALAAKWQARVEAARSAMRERLWHAERGTFCNRTVDGAWVDTVAIGSWMALYAGVPTAEQARQMAATLATPQWMTPLPMPTVGRCDPKWESGSMGNLPDGPKKLDHLGQAYNFWRGDCWPPTSYHVAAGLQRYGFHDLAARICDATIMNAIRWDDANERYDCDTGRPLGVPDLGLSACVFAMMTDGLTRRFAATLRTV